MSVRLDSNNPERYRELLEKYDTWMLDCDGVLWHGDRLIDGAVEFLEMLRSQGKRVLFVTNNATKSRRNYKKKFDGLGIEAHVVRSTPACRYIYRHSSSCRMRSSDLHMRLPFTYHRCSNFQRIRGRT